MTTENAKPAAWTLEQESVIAMYVEKLNMTRSNAIRKLRGEELRGKTPADLLSAGVARKPEPKAKPAKASKAKKAAKPIVFKGDAKHYDQQAVIDGFLKHGKTISELADAQKMSHVYCHRILTTKVPKEYAAEQTKRKAAREAAGKAAR
jgi:hypothetical protein